MAGTRGHRRYHPAERLRRALALGLIALALGCGGAGGPPAPPGASDPEQITFAPELRVDLSAMQRTPTGLYLQDIKEGNGPVVQRTSLVSVRYVGYLADGTIFDTTGNGEPVSFRLGGREVIRAWNQGLVGMRQGGIRRLVARPGLAYGKSARRGIPANSTLVFDVQLVDVR